MLKCVVQSMTAVNHEITADDVLRNLNSKKAMKLLCHNYVKYVGNTYFTSKDIKRNKENT